MGPGRDQLATPGSTIRLASVTRHVTDCATQPGNLCFLLSEILFEILEHLTLCNVYIRQALWKDTEYSKTCVKRPLKNRQNKDLNDKW